MTCLKRALKVANAAQQQLAMSAKRTGLSEPVRLYVDILNQYLYFFDQGVPNITVTVLQVQFRVTSDCVLSFDAGRQFKVCGYNQLMIRLSGGWMDASVHGLP